MRERFVVRTCDGILGAAGAGGLPGRSYVVLDRPLGYRLIAEYRSEDFRNPDGVQGGVGRAAMFEAARVAAYDHAGRLNGTIAPAPVVPKPAPEAKVPRKPQSHWSFRPTCPRCALLCPIGALHCSECGAYLYLTDQELAEITNRAHDRAR